MKVNVYFHTTQQAIELYGRYDDIKEIRILDSGHFALIHTNNVQSIFNSNHEYEILPNFLQVRRIDKGVFVDVDTLDKK